jgi:predicted short-subunit dehydrogenase-like oxidoreductase (DUF2520 family)
MIKRLTIIGSGNVATNLAMAFHKAGFEIGEVYSRNLTHATALTEKVGTKAVQEISALSAETDLIVLAIKDDVHETVLGELKLRHVPIVHTSGAKNLVHFKTEGYASYGVFYPLQSFLKNEQLDFKHIPICIEASDPKLLADLEQLASRLSQRVTQIDSEKRLVLHLAAVFANNFTNHLYALSGEVLSAANLPFDLLTPLIQHTANRLATQSPAELQTGPAIRGDVKTMQQHLELLDDENSRKIYEALSNSITKLGQQNKKG